MIRDEANVLIVLMGSLGDVVRGLSVAGRLKAFYPKCSISWLVEPASKSIVESCANIDRVIVFQRASALRTFAEFRKELTEINYDLVLDLQRHLKSGFFSWLSGGKRRLGFHAKNSKEGNFLFNNERIPFYPDSLSKLEHYQKFLDYLDVPILEEPDFGLKADGHADKRGCSLVIGSRWSSKDWPISGYAGLVKLLLENTDLEISILGTPNQLDNSKSLTASLDSSRVKNLVGETDLSGLSAKLRSSEFVIGPDSGPAHLSAAVGTPYVTLFGPTDPKRVAAYANENLVVRASIGCSPCSRRRCPGLNKICMRLISPELVYRKLVENKLISEA